MSIYYVLLFLCHTLLYSSSMDAMVSKAAKTGGAQKINASPRIQPLKTSASLWARTKARFSNYFMPKRSFHTLTLQSQQQRTVSKSWSFLDTVKRAASTMSINWLVSRSYNNYANDTERKTAILTEINRRPINGTFTSSQTNKICEIFTTMSEEPLKSAVFDTMVRVYGIGKDDYRFKHLYKQIALPSLFTRASYNSTRLNIIRALIGSYYKDDSEAVDYAFTLYSQLDASLDYSLKHRVAEQIIKSGVTKKERNKPETFYQLLDGQPDIYLITAIRKFDNENKYAADYANRMTQEWVNTFKKSKELPIDATTLDIVKAIVAHIEVNNREKGLFFEGHEYEGFASILLEDMLKNFKQSGIDPRVADPTWNDFCSYIVESRLEPLINLLTTYDVLSSSAPKKLEPEYNLPWAYQTLGLAYGVSYKDAHAWRNELALKYHPDRSGGDIIKMQNLDRALDIIKAHEHKKMYKEKSNTPEDV